MLDGLAWGVEPLALVTQLADFDAHAPIARRVESLLRAGTPLPEALAQLKAPATLVEAARLGGELNAHDAAGLRARAADDGRREARLTVLNGLALPLLTFLIASMTIATSQRMWMDVPGMHLPTWVPGTAWGLLLLSVLIIAAAVMPSFGARLNRLPGLRWIGARRRAARWADLLALTITRDGDLSETLTALGAAQVARQVAAGTSLPDALQRHVVGRQIVPAIRALPPAHWARALSNRARHLAAAADRAAHLWAIALRVSGTLLAALVVSAWLIAVYASMGGAPEAVVR